MSSNVVAFNNNINEVSRVLNAYKEATKNNIVALQEKYIVPIAARTVNDVFSTITGVKITGATNLSNSSTTNVTSASSCETLCKNNTSCVGALYTDTTPKSCQLYSSIPATQGSYSYDASSSFISYNNYMTPAMKAMNGSLGTVNANVMNALEERLKLLFNAMSGQITSMGDKHAEWDAATAALDAAKQTHIDFKNEKKINEEVQSQLRNSGLDVIRTKTKYILFIAALLILLAIYFRDFNFSIFVFIILFLMISVYGSIFLGAFLLVLIVLYLVYYAY